MQITLEIFCNEYEEFVKRNRAVKTYIGVCLVCNKLLGYFSPIKIIETIRLKDAEDFIHELKKTAPKAFYNYHRTLRAMFNKGIEWNYLRENVFAKIKLPKRQDSKPTFVTELMLWEIIKYIKIEVVKDIVIIAFYTGMRLGEIINITWNDVNLKDKILTIGSNNFQTKTRKQRIVPMHPKVEEILNRKFPKIIKIDSSTSLRVTGLCIL